jgi:Kef-type K+ transport system membrane component KefB
VSFSGVALVALLAFAVPLVLGLFPRLRLPSVVVEIIAGIVVGPSVLDWVQPDIVLQVLSVMGLAFLLFLAGLEIDIQRFKGKFLQESVLGLVLSLALAIGVGLALNLAGLADSPLFIAIVLLATSLGLVIPVLRDAAESTSTFGQLTIAGSALADFCSVILLSLFFSGESTEVGAQLLLLGGFAAVAAATGIALARAGHSMRVSDALLRLQDTTAQVRVRGAVVLMIGLIALAETFGLEVILGAFLAGAILRLVDRGAMVTHPNFHVKLDAIGFGFLIPVFFVTSGVTFDLEALLADASTIVLVPVFLISLVIVRGLPALLYAPLIGGRRTASAVFLQATSLPFIVAASQIGMEIGVIDRATGAGLVAAGLMSVLIFPLLALTILRNAGDDDGVRSRAALGKSTAAQQLPGGERSGIRETDGRR